MEKTMKDYLKGYHREILQRRKNILDILFDIVKYMQIFHRILQIKSRIPFKKRATEAVLNKQIVMTLRQTNVDEEKNFR